VVVGDGGCEADTVIRWGALLRSEIPKLAAAETVSNVAGNLGGTAMRGAEGNTGRQRTLRAQDRASVTQGLARGRHVAREKKKERFTTRLHPVSVDLLRGSFFALKRDAARGVDGMTWQDSEKEREPRLSALHDRVDSGAYRPQPSRRRYIPKPDGRQRPLAGAAPEDKIVQRAAVLNAIDEEDCLGFS
jgi:RNA-directed DNA polymerase